MRIGLSACASVVVLTIASAFATAQKPRSVWDGIYTNAQASRGQQAFSRSCAGCHRDDLRGGAEGEPPLTGVNFTAEWDGKTTGALLDLIATNMPKSNPGSLPLETSVDIVSFLLKANGMPAGRTDLPADVQELDQIVFTAQPPAR